MHILQHKHSKIKADEAEALLKKLNISSLQLPKIKRIDPAIPADVKIGDIIKIERKGDSEEKTVYYRIVVVE